MPVSAAMPRGPGGQRRAVRSATPACGPHLPLLEYGVGPRRKRRGATAPKGGPGARSLGQKSAHKSEASRRVLRGVSRLVRIRHVLEAGHGELQREIRGGLHDQTPRDTSERDREKLLDRELLLTVPPCSTGPTA